MPTSFDTAYEKLNPQQKIAVDTIDGPVMVIAGPGTGKTQILTLRIANILRTQDIKPQNILALTFTEVAALTMRKRLIDLIGVAGYSVRIQTFHGFCQTVISEHPEHFPFGADVTPASELQTHVLMEELLDDPKLVSLRTPGSKYHYLRKILASINTLKSEGITPARFVKLVAAEREVFTTERESLSKSAAVKRVDTLAKQEELATLYTRFQRELRKRNLIDFTDMLMHTVEALRNSEILRTQLQEHLQYILIDEYQDTNGAQNTVVDLLASFWGGAANVFVVGDPHQTIFRFQGASFENTIGFLTRYPAAQVITLTTGYRCSVTINQSAHSLIANNTNSLDLLLALASKSKAIAYLVEGISRPLIASTDISNPIEIALLPTKTDETSWVAHQIQAKINSGVDPREIAVLVKTNDQATQLSSVFTQHAIDHQVDRTTDALTSLLGVRILSLLRALVHLTDNTESEHLYAALSAPWMDLSPVAIMSLTRAFSKQKKETSFFSFVSSGWNQVKQSTDLTCTKEEYLSIFTKLEKLLELSTLALTFAPPNWIASIYAELHLTTWVQSQANISENLIILSAFHDFFLESYTTDPTVSVKQIVSFLDTMEQQKLPLPITPMHSSRRGVIISTVHKAKGKEWDHVYLPFFTDGNWGGGRAKSSIVLPEGIIATQKDVDETEDDRRLLYVALTRSKQTLTLTRAQTQGEFGKVNETIPSQFLLEIPSELTVTVDTSSHEQISAALTHLNPTTPKQFGQMERDWVQSIVDRMSLSVSVLNTYLRDPRSFFVQHILRVPQSVQSHLAFGNAVHAALEAHFRYYRTHDNTHPAPLHALTAFETRLAQEVISANDQASRLAQGRIVLQQYLESRRDERPQILALEEGFGWKRGPILMGDILLSGKIDRMDILEDGNRSLHIIDYKTGKQKSTNTIEGKVGTSEMSERERNLPEPIRGAMKRQLLFYRLLLSLDPLYSNWDVGRATFDFVQPDGEKFIERSFELKNDDVKLLEALIKEVVAEIRELKFLDDLEQ